MDPYFANENYTLTNARTVSEKLNCSTQPVMYHFATIKELKRAVYAKSDRYHTEYLMNIEERPKGTMLGIGLNYIRFAIKEPHLFRFLFQSGFANPPYLPAAFFTMCRYSF